MSFIKLENPELADLVWPKLSQLALPTSEIAARRHGIGGSDANVIVSGDAERIRTLWLEKRGSSAPADLSSKLQVMLGCWTEEFNRQWFEQATGMQITCAGEMVQCRRYDWRRCTIDGLVQGSTAVWEAKHTSAFASTEDVVERYMPQLQHNMAVVGADQAILSVIFGNHKYEVIEVASDWLYQLELLEAEADFWDCVITGKEPVPAPVPVSPRPVGLREVCFEGNNAWAAAAADWLSNRDAAKVHASASKTLKELVEDDVARAFGHRIEAKRSRSGAITIRELNQ